MAGKSKRKSDTDARNAKKNAPRKPAEPAKAKAPKQQPAEAAPAVTRKDVRALQDAVADLRKQVGVLDELARGLRKQVKRLKKAEPANRGRAANDDGAIDDGAPGRPLARAIGA